MFIINYSGVMVKDMGQKSIKEVYARRLLCILIFAVCVLGPAAGPVCAQKQENGRHFIWSVRKGDSTAYLLGSIHILRESSYPLPAAVRNIFNCCSVFVFETDLSAMNEKAARILSLARYPGNQTLRTGLSGGTYRLLQAKMSRLGLPMEQFEKFRPWFVALQLANYELVRLGFNPELGVDRYFFNRAEEAGKKMMFLESNEYQIKLFAGLSPHQQEALLLQMLKEMEVIDTMFADMLSAWKTGDTEKFGSILSLSYREFPDIYRRIIVRRNERWIGRLEKLMERNEDMLVIVGSAHLVGERSVVELLREKGYTVNQQ